MPPKGEIKSEKILTKDVFKKWFRIPEYQRPYVWGYEEINDLMDDLSYALSERPDYEYFLGSFVFQAKPAAPELNRQFDENDLLDGQQRLTTLLLLIAVIRDLVLDPKVKKKCQEYIFQEADIIENIPERVRLVFGIREKVNEFIEQYIKAEGGTNDEAALARITQKAEDISVKNMAAALLEIRKFFQKKPNIKPDGLLPFLANKVLMIYVASEDLEDAFRLFMILNDRGIPLRNSDILKSMNLGALELDTEKIKYAKLWEEAEGELGDDFDRFLNHVRTILVKERPRLSLLREFEDKIYDPKEKDKATGQQKSVLLKKGKETFALIEKYLNHYKKMLGGQNYDDIGNFKFDNLIKTMWVGLPATDWMPPLLRYFDRFGYTRLMDFMHKLDNKFSADWIGQKTPTDRIEAMNDVIKVIDLAISGDEVLNSTCFDFDQDAFLRVLDGPVYGRRFTKYLMLKLDYYYQNHDQKMHFETLSVEHILPQNPADDSRWVMDFSPAEREEGTHKLGNLVLITCGKNTAQGRKDFADKVRSYFLKNIDTCPNSLRVLNNYHQWTPTELQNNHETVIQKIREYYRVQCMGQGLKTLVPKIIGLAAAVQEKKSSGSREAMQWDELSFFQDFDTRNLLEESKIARKIFEWAKTRMSSANPWGKGVSYGTFYPKFIFKDITIPFFNVFSSGRIEISFREIRKVSAFDGDAKRLELLHRLNQVPGISLSSDFINRYPTILLSVLKDDATLNQFLGVFDWVIKEIKSSADL